MKKDIVKRLKSIADVLPLVWKTEQDYVIMSAEELRLTPVDDIIQLEPGKNYKIPIPKFVAVYHEQQVKDAYKKGGALAVKEYVKSVTK
jgi:hypothetical protein